MKKVVVMAFCLLAGSFFQGNVSAQGSRGLQEQTVSSDDNERLQNLILRYTHEWSAAGYSIMSYIEFQYQRPLPDDIMARFHQSFMRYANKEYGGENTTFVIYKQVPGGTVYELQVLEDTAGQAFPNKYTRADIY